MTDVPWAAFAAAEPEFAAVVAGVITGHPHHVLATVRPDGSPRVGGSNVFITDGVLWLGCMRQAKRIGDLAHDPRCAIHTAPLDEQLTVGDVRLDLVARPMTDDEFARFMRASGQADEDGNSIDGQGYALSIRALSVVTVAGDELVVTRWSPGTGRTETRAR